MFPPPGPDAAAHDRPPVFAVHSRAHASGPARGGVDGALSRAAAELLDVLVRPRVVNLHLTWNVNLEPARGHARGAERPVPGDARKGHALAPFGRPSPVEDDTAGGAVMCITRPVHAEILDALTGRRPEAGGMLLGPKNHHAVTHFVLDERARATATSFTLDHVGLNEVLGRYRACAIDMKGFVHSHPEGCTRPSAPDVRYVFRTFANPKHASVREFLLPIVCGGEFFPYVVVRGDDPRSASDVLSAKLVLI